MARALASLAFLSVLGLSAHAVAAQPLATGTVVWAQWSPNGWYHGSVQGVCEEGLDVAFDDGDRGCISHELVTPDQAFKGYAALGQRVLAKWTDGRLYPATVTGAGGGEAQAVQFDDGAIGRSAPGDMRALRLPAVLSTVLPSPGTRVFAQWRPNNWYRGVIGPACAGGVHVDFEDGDKGCIHPALLAQVAPAKRYRAGERVMAIWGDGRLYPATLLTLQRDGRWRVRFDDRALGAASPWELRPMFR